MINRSKNSVSSSLLPMLPAHSENASDSVYVGTELIEVFTLDEVFFTYFEKDDSVFLKIDTQGYEDQVLMGAKKSLKFIDSIQIELSIVELYENQKLFRYFLDFLGNEGFKLWALEPGFTSPFSGQLLQFDGFFHKG